MPTCSHYEVMSRLKPLSVDRSRGKSASRPIGEGGRPSVVNLLSQSRAWVSMGR